MGGGEFDGAMVLGKWSRWAVVWGEFRGDGVKT